MAEDLGQAQLELTINLESFKRDLETAKRLVKDARLGLDFDTTPAQVAINRQRREAQRTPRPLDLGADQQSNRTRPQPTPPSQPQRQQTAPSTQQNRDAIGNAIIGGAFPLLFGQGAGASLGGGVGGLLGGALGGNFGFGLSLVGTAVGTAIDSLNQRFKDLAIALENPVASFDKIKEASVLSSKAQEKYAQALIDAGRSAEAAQLIQAEAARTIDPGNALLLAGSSDELGRSFSDLQDKISNFTSGAAVGFNAWLTEVIRIATGAPTAGTPLTGPQAVTAGNRQQLGGGALIASGLGALALAASAPVSLPIALGIGALGLGATAFGAAGIEGGRQRNSVATSNEVKAVEAEIQAILERQKSTQDQINAAKAAGLTKTAELLQVSKQFQDADTAAAKARLQVEGQLAARQINKATATQRLKDIEDARNTTVQNLVANQQAAAAAAKRQLEDAQALQGLKGAELQIAQQLLQVDAARRNAQQANAAVSTAGASGASPAELEALKNAAQAAGDTLKTAIIAGADAIKEAAEQARVNFESAAKALQSTSESNFDFLDKETQNKVLAQARRDIAIGVEQGGIDKRFLDLGNNTEAILAAAQASRSQVDALDKFNAASAEYTTATNAAKDAISQLDSKLPEVQTNLAQLDTTVKNLVDKNWEVTVNVDATTGASEVQLG